MRNGPNPLFKPISYTYPMDGDGMIHAVYLDNGRARYRNRFVQTAQPRGRAARRARGLWRADAPECRSIRRSCGRASNPGPFKNGAFISVLRHGDHLLALGEAIDRLRDDDGARHRRRVEGGHRRADPARRAQSAPSADRRAVRARLQRRPSRSSASSTSTRPASWCASFDATLAAPTMIHDFVLTERHIVLLAGARWCSTWRRRAPGSRCMQWKPDLGMRIGVLGLDGGSPLWLEAEPFFVFHFANGFERAGGS